MIEEFRKFVMRGNVLDLAIGIIIGAAFTSIVNSLVEQIINPLIGLIVGGRADFTGYALPLTASPDGPTLGYGAFITAIINFLIIALVLFFIVQAANRLAREKVEPDSPPEPTVEEKLLSEIRDLLKQRPA